MHGISRVAQDLSVLCCELHSKTCLHKAGRPSCSSGFDKGGSRERLLYTWHVVLLKFSVNDWMLLCISCSKCQRIPARGVAISPLPTAFCLCLRAPASGALWWWWGLYLQCIYRFFWSAPSCSPGKLMRLRARQLRGTHMSQVRSV